MKKTSRRLIFAFAILVTCMVGSAYSMNQASNIQQPSFMGNMMQQMMQQMMPQMMPSLGSQNSNNAMQRASNTLMSWMMNGNPQYLQQAIMFALQSFTNSSEWLKKSWWAQPIINTVNVKLAFKISILITNMPKLINNLVSNAQLLQDK